MVRAISQIKVSAPGSTMLMGEHAVLFGHRAIACAVDKRIHLTLTPRHDRQVVIDSALAQYQSTLDDLAADERLSFVLYAISQVAKRCPSGFTLTITAGFSHTVGLGSSAAVTAATVAALASFCGDDCAPEALFDRALAVVLGVQGRGSGTDLAASIYGGMIAYTVAPRNVTPLAAESAPALALYYSGYKTRTPVVLERVAQQAAALPELYADIYQLMHHTSCEAEQAVGQQNWEKLGKLINLYQGLMDALGVNDKTLSEIIYTLRGCAGVQGAKISGSGLGDCVLMLGEYQGTPLPYERIEMAISPTGVEIDVI